MIYINEYELVLRNFYPFEALMIHCMHVIMLLINFLKSINAYIT